MNLFNKIQITILAIAACALPTGCASTTPTAFDRAFATVETNYVPFLVLHTNVVTVTKTNVETVTVTNQVTGAPVVVYQTNMVAAYQTNVIPVTETKETYKLTPNSTAQVLAGVAGAGSNILAPGTGGLAGAAVMGLLSIWLGIRNRQFAGRNDALSQSAGVLAQIIETGREVMATTPQGKAAANAFTQWMVSHQADTETISTIAGLVKENVDNEEAQKAAAQILAMMGRDKPAA